MKLKNIFLSCAFVAVLSSCNNTTQKNNSEDADVVVSDSTVIAGENRGKIEFGETVYDFGTVKEGEIVEHVFKFTNTGEAPVILSQVSASCGCTTPNYTKDPILPGKEGEINVSFDSKGQVGKQQKIITVSSNAANNVTTVQIKGVVEE